MRASESDRVAHYWSEYFSWRLAAGLDDAAMRDVVAAIWKEINSHVVSGHEAARLKKLARMIEAELEIVDGMDSDSANVA